MNHLEYYTPIKIVLEKLKEYLQKNKDKGKDKEIIWINPKMTKYGPIPLSYVVYLYKYDKEGVDLYDTHSLYFSESTYINPIVKDRIKQLSSYTKEDCIDYYINWN